MTERTVRAENGAGVEIAEERPALRPPGCPGNAIRAAGGLESCPMSLFL